MWDKVTYISSRRSSSNQADKTMHEELLEIIVKQNVSKHKVGKDLELKSSSSGPHLHPP